MIDLQSEIDKRGLSLDLVGIKNLKLPLKINLKGLLNDSVLTTVEVFTILNHNQRGTHMSRMVEVFNDFLNKSLDSSNLQKICQRLQASLKTQTVYVNLGFDFFLPKPAPISGGKSLLNYNCLIKNELAGRIFNQSIILQIPVMLLCPCSKAISEKNAHNQRSIITLEIVDIKNLNLKKIIKMVEDSASTHIYPLLKRVDEKYVTEKSYDNPKFVEDITRDIVLKLKKQKKLGKFIIECESFESIHNHNAYAKLLVD